MSERSALDCPAIQAVLQHRLWDYALRRQQEVHSGHETADLAGLLTQTYGFGLVEAVRALLGPDGKRVATRLLAAVDHAVEQVDPDWKHHATQRWAARPACLAVD
jgi:hypothetical protein